MRFIGHNRTSRKALVFSLPRKGHAIVKIGSGLRSWPMMASDPGHESSSMRKPLSRCPYCQGRSGGGPARQGDGLLSRRSGANIHCPKGLGGSNPPLRAHFYPVSRVSCSISRIEYTSLPDRQRQNPFFPFLSSHRQYVPSILEVVGLPEHNK